MNSLHVHAPKLLLALALTFLAGVSLSGCIGGGSARRGGLPKARIAKFPPKVAKAYGLFAVRCSRCHTLARPLNAAITEYGHWKSYVKRMRHHAGSGISPRDADTILVFLRYYAELRSKELEDNSLLIEPQAPMLAEKGAL